MWAELQMGGGYKYHLSRNFPFVQVNGKMYYKLSYLLLRTLICYSRIKARST